MKLSTVKFGLLFLFTIFMSCGKATEKSVEERYIVDTVTPFFKSEVKPDNAKPCFNGAYYRKMVSSKHCWLGIGGKVTLPTITFDPLRTNSAKPGQYLDNPSVYLGGSMGGQETDIGLTWEVIRDANGNVSADRKVFRPFFLTQNLPHRWSNCSI